MFSTKFYDENLDLGNNQIYRKIEAETGLKDFPTMTSDFQISNLHIFRTNYFLIFSKNHSDNVSFAEMSSEMMMLIRKQFIDNLDDLDWLDQETRSYAKRKASDIVDNIGYPGGWFIL